MRADRMIECANNQVGGTLSANLNDDGEKSDEEPSEGKDKESDKKTPCVQEMEVQDDCVQTEGDDDDEWLVENSNLEVYSVLGTRPSTKTKENKEPVEKTAHKDEQKDDDEQCAATLDDELTKAMDWVGNDEDGWLLEEIDRQEQPQAQSDEQRDDDEQCTDDDVQGTEELMRSQMEYMNLAPVEDEYVTNPTGVVMSS